MKKFRKKCVAAVVMCCALLSMGLTGCAGDKNQTAGQPGNGKEAEVNIAYQYGLAYAPLIIAKEQGLIEKAYEDATGQKVNVTWNQMSSGSDINTAFVSGSINVGFMGVAPAITGVANDVGYKIFTNLSGQEHALMTNSEDLNTLSDLVGSDSQIALVNIGSIQHIILGMALDHAGYDAHSLDSNIVVMKHPDGMTALESGSVPCHLSTNPYIYKEMENSQLHEIEGISDVWSVDSSFIVGIASEDLEQSDPELYSAVCEAIEEAINYINDNPEEAAEITCEFNGNTKEDEIKYLQKGNYSVDTKGIFSLADFMSSNGFIDKKFESYKDLVFDNVTGD